MSGPKGIDFYFDDGTPSLAGDSFVVIKASEGAAFPPDGAIPQWYAAEQARIRAAGALFGAFLFWHPAQDNAAQVANFKKRANLRTGDVIQLDMEATDGLDWASISVRKNDMQHRLRTAFPQNRVLTYTYIDYWAHVDHTLIDGLWIADPNSPAGQPRVTSWLVHQYATSGVDYDIANFPDAAALRAWANFSTVAPLTTEEDDMLIVQFNENKAADNGASGIFLLAGGKLLPFKTGEMALQFKGAGIPMLIATNDGTLGTFTAASRDQIALTDAQVAMLAAQLVAGESDPALLAAEGKAIAHAEAVEEHNDTPPV